MEESQVNHPSGSLSARADAAQVSTEAGAVSHSASQPKRPPPQPPSTIPQGCCPWGSARHTVAPHSHRPRTLQDTQKPVRRQASASPCSPSSPLSCWRREDAPLQSRKHETAKTVSPPRRQRAVGLAVRRQSRRPGGREGGGGGAADRSSIGGGSRVVQCHGGAVHTGRVQVGKGGRQQQRLVGLRKRAGVARGGGRRGTPSVACFQIALEGMRGGQGHEASGLGVWWGGRK